MNAKAEAKKIISKYLHIDDEEPLVNAIVVAFEARDKELELLKVRLSCGHRKVDFDDSYGECVFCKIKQMADDYDRLPLDVIACHDEIEKRDEEIAELKAEIKWLRADFQKAHDLNEWFRKRCNWYNSELERLKGGDATLKAERQKAAGWKVDRCACVFEGIDNDPVSECAYHKEMREEIEMLKKEIERLKLKAALG